MAERVVAVIGASADRSKYGNKAVRAFRDAGWTVYPVHPSAESVEGLTVYRSVADLPAGHIDRASFYVPPRVGIGVVEELAERGDVGEVWLNPGSESELLIARAEELGMEVVMACSILAVGGDPGM